MKSIPALNSVRVGVIGVGNMGRALIRGLMDSGVVAADRVSVCEQRREMVADLGVTIFDSPRQVADAADVVIVCVKPHHVAGVLDELAAGSRLAVVISIAAGLTVASLRDALGARHDVHVVRAMPNTAAALRASTTAWVAPASGDPALASLVTTLLGAFGEVVALDDESKMHAFTAVAGSGPAFVALFAEALADGAVAEGMPREAARHAAASMLLGAARLLLEPGAMPGTIKDAVASPGGTTIAGVAALEDAGFRSATIKAVRAAAARSKEMAHGK
jgi:pyrroline-5-carboxylate reductase